LLQGKALSVNFFQFLQETFNFRSPNRQLQFAHNLFFDLGRSLGKADRKEAKAKIGAEITPIEEVSLLPVSLAYRGWASCRVLPGSNFSAKADEFALMWQQEFSFEAESWLKAKKQQSVEKEAAKPKKDKIQEEEDSNEGSGSNSSEEDDDGVLVFAFPKLPSFFLTSPLFASCIRVIASAHLHADITVAGLRPPWASLYVLAYAASLGMV